MADSYIALGLDFMPPKEAFPKARGYALKALELDDQLAEAHGSLGLVKFLYEWDWSAAEKELRPALADAKTMDTLSCFLHYKDSLGQPDEAVMEVKQALNRDPLSLVLKVEVACASYYARQPDQAIREDREVIEMDPSFAVAYYGIGRAYGQKGMYDEAIVQLNQARDLSGNWSAVIAELGYDYAMSGRRVEAQKILRELRELATARYVDPYLMAVVYSGLREKDQALAFLERACEDRSSWIPWLKVEPKFDSLRSETRFANLLRRVGFAP